MTPLSHQGLYRNAPLMFARHRGSWKRRRAVLRALRES